MKVYLSNRGNLGNFSNFLDTVDLSSPGTLEVSMHPTWANAHPAALVFCAALALAVGKENASITGPIPPTAASFARMGLFDFFNTPSPFAADDREGSGLYIPLSIIKEQADQSRFISDMIPLLHLPEDKSTIIKYVIGELVRNVLEHAKSPNGAVVAARYYKQSNRISIGICDTGIGVWKSMQTTWDPRTDLEALRLALTPGITGTTRKEGGTEDNAGAGLFFIKSIAKITRSYFVIYSGKAEYSLLKHDKRVKTHPRLFADPFRDKHSTEDNIADFNGTLVGIDISLGNNKAFDALLSSIGEVYDEAIRERKRAKFKEPKFI